MYEALFSYSGNKVGLVSPLRPYILSGSEDLKVTAYSLTSGGKHLQNCTYAMIL